MYAFTLWQDYGHRPGYIDLAMETQARNLPLAFEHVHLDMESARDWCPHVDRYWRAATPSGLGRSVNIEARHTAQFTGILRTYLLAKYGGAWIDTDTFVYPGFSSLIAALESFDLVCSERQNQKLSNCIIGGREKSSFFERLLEVVESKIDEKISSDKTANWGEFGFRLMKDLFMEIDPASAFVIPMGLLIPDDQAINDSIFSADSDDRPAITELAFATSFFNNGISEEFRSLDKSALLSKPSLIAEMYRRAIDPPRESRVTQDNFFGLYGALNRARVVRLYHECRESERLGRQQLARARQKVEQIRKRARQNKDKLARLQKKHEMLLSRTDAQKSKITALKSKLEMSGRKFENGEKS